MICVNASHFVSDSFSEHVHSFK